MPRVLSSNSFSQTDMKTAIILDDRPGRQSKMLGESGLKALKSIEGLTVAESEVSQKLIKAINQSDSSGLAGYGHIAIHRSSLTEEGQAHLTQFCKNENSVLVLFSGDISQYTYSPGDMEFLLLSSVDFYNPERLKNYFEAFCGGNEPSLLQIVLGGNVRLSRLMALRQNKVLHAYETNEVLKDELELKTERLSLELGVEAESIDLEINQLIEQI